MNRRIKSFPIALVAYAVAFYLVLAGYGLWVLIPLVIVFLERLLVQLALYFVTVGVQRILMQAAAARAAEQQPPPDPGPPLMGGRIDDPQE